MNNYCSNCGEPLAGAKFCPNCGEPVPNQSDKKVDFVSTEYREPSQRIQESYVDATKPVKKSSASGNVLFAFLFLILCGTLFTLIYVNLTPDTKSESNNKSASKSESASQKTDNEKLLDFDKQSWTDFKTLYTSHNNFMELVTNFGDGKIDSLTFYDECKKVEDYFGKVSLTFDYGTNDDEITYLQPFEVAALADQQAAKALMKYADSGKTSQLSDAQEQIQRAKDAFTTIASNRGTLLVKAGLTDEEIKEKVETDMEDLESTDEK